MPIHAFPAVKLGLLLLKHISRPIVDVIKVQAQNSNLFRSYVCTPPAHLYNWCEVKTKMWVLNLGRPINVPPLQEAVAIDLGANLIGELIIFTTAATGIISEYNKSVKKETEKEQAKEQELATLKNLMKDLFQKKDEMAAEIREVSRKLVAMEHELDNTPYIQ